MAIDDEERCMLRKDVNGTWAVRVLVASGPGQ